MLSSKVNLHQTYILKTIEEAKKINNENGKKTSIEKKGEGSLLLTMVPFSEVSSTFRLQNFDLDINLEANITSHVKTI